MNEQNMSVANGKLAPTPSIGRIVTFHFAERSDQSDAGQSKTVPAIIVNVWSDTCVNLRVFQDGSANPLWETSVMRRDCVAPEFLDGCNTWEWPDRVGK